MLRVPDYFEDFRCLAGACPHSCCEAWEVVLDEATVKRYRALPGPLGDKLRAAMEQREEEVCFPLRGGRCPFWDTDNLCEIHKALGAEATSETCRAHPRFIEEYDGNIREVTLAASCPAANELLLSSAAPLTFPVTEAGEVPEDLVPLFALRERMLTLVQEGEMPLKERLFWLLALAEEAQAALDREEEELLLDLAEAELSCGADGSPSGEPLFPAALEALGELEILGGDWPELLEAGKTAPGLDLEEHAALLGRICAYFLFRWVCKAVGDGDLLSKVQLALLGTLTAARLGSLCGLGEALRRFCREVEHSGENLDALQEKFCFDERLWPERFFASFK